MKAFNRAVEGEGLASPPVGLDKIETQTKRKGHAKESHGSRKGGEEEEWEGTHRADTTRREVRRKKSAHVDLSEGESAEEGGTGVHREVLEAVGDITEEDLRGQKEELDRLAKERARRRKATEDSSDSEVEGGEEELNRLVEEIRQGAKKRKRGGDGAERSGIVGGGEGAGRAERSDEQEGGDGVDGRTEENTSEGNNDRGNSSSAKKAESAAARRKAKRGRRVENLRQDATRFVTEWGVAKLKGVDLSECSGVSVEEGRPCREVLNKGVKAQSEGNVVLMK